MTIRLRSIPFFSSSAIIACTVTITQQLFPLLTAITISCHFSHCVELFIYVTVSTTKISDYYAKMYDIVALKTCTIAATFCCYYQHLLFLFFSIFPVSFLAIPLLFHFFDLRFFSVLLTCSIFLTSSLHSISIKALKDSRIYAHESYIVQMLLLYQLHPPSCQDSDLEYQT